MKSGDHIAVSADLVGSRLAADRHALMSLIESTLESLGRSYRREMLAIPVLTRGLDEFSAVFKTPKPLFDFMVQLNESLWPARFRLGVGIGRIDLAEESGNAGKMDGPAFHLAAEALSVASRSGSALVIRAPDADQIDLMAIEALARAHSAIVEDWTPGVAKVIPSVRAAGTQEAVARLLNIRQQAVSKAVRRARLDVLVQLEGAGRALVCSRL